MSRTRTASLTAIFAVVFIDLLGFGIVLPLLARYGKYFEAEAWLGALLASFSLMQFLFAPAWGRLSDRIGRRPVLLVGLAGSTCSYALFGVATGLSKDATLLGLSPLAWLFISRIGAGIAGATISTAHAYIADVTEESERAKGMALIGAAFGIGFTFGPMLGAAFVSDDPASPPSPYPGYIAAALSGLAFLGAAFVLQEPERRHSVADARPRGRWSLLAEPVRLALFGEIFLTTAAFAVFESTLALLSASLGYSDRDNFYLFAFVGVMLSVAQGFLVRRLAPRLQERRMVPLGLVLLAVGLAGLALVGAVDNATKFALYATLGLCVVGVSFVSPSLQSLLSRTALDNQQGVVLGLGQSAAALARIAGPLIGIWLFQRSIPLAYGAAAGVIAISLVAMLPVLAAVGRHARPERATSVIPDAESDAEPDRVPAG